MTRPAQISIKDLQRHPQLNEVVQTAIQKQSNQEQLVIPLPRPMNVDKLEIGAYGFMVGVLFMGCLGILGGII